MAIEAYYGKPRNGKSYSVVANVLIPALENGRNVYTNIPLAGDYKDMSNYNIFDNKVDALYFAGLPAGSVIVIDEAWRYFPAGERVSVIPEEVKEFLAMHGHNVDEEGNTTQIVIVSQGANQIGSFIKGLVQNAYKITKKGEKQFRTDHFSGESAENLKGEYDSQFYTKFDPKIFAAYQTSTNSATGSAGNEKKLDKRGGLGSSYLLKYGMPLALLLICFGLYKGYEQFSSIGKKPDIKVKQPRPSIPQPSDNQVTTRIVVTEEPLVPLSTVYSVSGWSQYKVNDPVTVHITHTSGKVYPVPAADCERFLDSYTCMIQGTLVTPHTGKPDHVYNIQAIAQSKPL